MFTVKTFYEVPRVCIADGLFLYFLFVHYTVVAQKANAQDHYDIPPKVGDFRIKLCYSRVYLLN